MHYGKSWPIIAFALLLGVLAARERGYGAMQDLELIVDGQPVALNPAARLNGADPWVPVHALGPVIGAEAKKINGQLALCKGDLCVPLASDKTENGDVYVTIADVAEPFGLGWQVKDQTLRLSLGRQTAVGLGIGQRPPGFTLPDLRTGKPVSLANYAGGKTVFYMWASW